MLLTSPNSPQQPQSGAKAAAERPNTLAVGPILTVPIHGSPPVEERAEKMSRQLGIPYIVALCYLVRPSSFPPSPTLFLSSTHFRSSTLFPFLSLSPSLSRSFSPSFSSSLSLALSLILPFALRLSFPIYISLPSLDCFSIRLPRHDPVIKPYISISSFAIVLTSR